MKKQIQNFNKSDLAIHLSRKFPTLNDETIVEGIDLMLQEIINSVALDNRVEIRGFGSFEIFTTKERVGRNPKTMENYKIPSQNKVRFSPTLKAKYFLN